jgi:hypothetical protein
MTVYLQAVPPEVDIHTCRKYGKCVIECGYGVSVEINIEYVKILLLLRQAFLFGGWKLIEAVCETTVTGSVALK